MEIKINKKNKWAWGAGILLTVIGGILIAVFDGKEDTNIDLDKALNDTGAAVKVFKDGDDGSSASTAVTEAE